jgi:Fibronectin type III domain/Dockerin type I domain
MGKGFAMGSAIDRLHQAKSLLRRVCNLVVGRNFASALLRQFCEPLETRVMLTGSAWNQSFHYQSAPQSLSWTAEAGDIGDPIFTNLLTGQVVNTSVDASWSEDVGDEYNATATFPDGVLPSGYYEPVMSMTGDDDDQVDLSMFSFLNADANRDGVVDANDLAIFQANNNQSGKNFTQGDFNYDGTVNALDYSILASNYGIRLQNPPSAPVQAVAQADGDNQIFVSWGAVSNPSQIDGYHIFRSGDGNNFTLIGTVGPNVTTFADQGLPDGTQFWYRVRAFTNAAGNSASPNKTTTATVLDAPTDLQVMPQADGTMLVGWVNQSASATQIVVQWTDENGVGDSATVGSDQTSFVTPVLTNSAEYTISVTAYSAIGQPSAATEQTVTPTIGPPEWVTENVVSPTQCELMWPQVSSAEQYIVSLSSTTPDDFVDIATLPAGQTDYVVSGLTPGTSYSVAVSSMKGSLRSGGMVRSSISTWGGTLSVTPQSDGTMQLSWPSDSANTTGWHLDWRPVENQLDHPGDGHDSTLPATQQSTTISGLTPGQMYEFLIYDANAYAQGLRGLAIAGLAAPSGLAASDVTTDGLTLNWTGNSSLADGYIIYVSADGTNFSSIDEVDSDTTSYDLSGLVPGATFWAKVTADSANGESNPSNVVEVTTLPAAPTGLSATVSKSDEIDLSWVDQSDGTASTIIYFSTNGTSFTQLDEVAAGTSEYAATGLTPDGHYTFKIASDYSGQTATDTDTLTATAISAALTPGSGDSIAEGSAFTLSLTSTQSDNLSYPIDHWLIDWNDGSNIETVSGDSGDTSPHDFADGTQSIDISITAVDTHGNTFVLPDKTLGIIPTAPTNLTATMFSESQIDLAWNDNSDNEDGFTIERSDDGGTTFNVIGFADANATTFSDTGLDPSTTYEYEIAATWGDRDENLNGDGAGGNGNGGQTTRPTTQPTTTPTGQVTLNASNDPLTGALILTWTYQGHDASNFELEYKHEGFAENYTLVGVYGSTNSGSGVTGSHTMDMLDPDDSYDFRIRADRTDGTVSDYDTKTGVKLIGKMDAPTITISSQNWVTVDVGNYDHDEWELSSMIGEFKADALGSDWHPIEFGPTYGSGDIFTFISPTGGLSNATFRVAGVYDAWDDPSAIASSHFATTSLTSSSDVASPQNLTLQAPTSSDPNWEVTYTAQSGMQTTLTEISNQTPWGWPMVGLQTQTSTNGHASFGASDDYVVAYNVDSQNHGPSNATVIAGRGTVPDQPEFIHAVYDPSVAGGKIQLSWANSSNNETGFKIYESDNGGPETLVGQKGADDTTFTEKANKVWPYTFRVVAFNDAGTSGGTTASCRPIGGPEITAHLINIRKRARNWYFGLSPSDKATFAAEWAKTWTQTELDMLKGIDRNPSSNWDIYQLAAQGLQTPHNTGVLPDQVGHISTNNQSARTVSVTGGVFSQEEVNYWLYGVIWNMLGFNQHDAINIIIKYRIKYKGGTGIPGRIAWFSAGYNNDFTIPFNFHYIDSDGHRYNYSPILNVWPYPAPPEGDECGPLRFEFGSGSLRDTDWG